MCIDATARSYIYSSDGDGIAVYLDAGRSFWYCWRCPKRFLGKYRIADVGSARDDVGARHTFLTFARRPRHDLTMRSRRRNGGEKESTVVGCL